jgi:hypothetical protein
MGMKNNRVSRAAVIRADFDHRSGLIELPKRNLTKRDMSTSAAG